MPFLSLWILLFGVALDGSAQKKSKVKPKPAAISPGQNDTTKTADTIKTERKRDIETTINYSAEDSITMDATDKSAVLYKGGHIQYGTKDIKADQIAIDYKTNIIHATHVKDSTGKKKGVPVFKDGSENYVANEIKYNYKTRKGLVKEIVTQQGEGFVHGEIVKKDPDNVMYLAHAMYTTCNLKHPHFYIKSSKLKMIPGRKIISGPFHLRIGDIPTPLAFFFGYFPIPKKRSSGFIMPMYGESRDRGFFFRGGGYYWPINDNVGAKLLVDLYTVGGWGSQLLVDYKKRYTRSGNLNLQYTYFVSNPEDALLRSVKRGIWVTWQHTPDTRGKSYTFSANVSGGSSSFNTNTSFNIALRQTANFNSNINLNTTFRNTPFTMGASARLDQDVVTGIMNFDLPNINVSMNRIYPFKNLPLRGALADPIKKLSFSYNGNFINRITNIASNTYQGFNVVGRDSILTPSSSYYARGDTVYLFKGDQNNSFNGQMGQFLKNSKYGVVNSIPITTTIKLFKFFSLNPSMNLTEYIYQRRFEYHDWTPSSPGVKIDTLPFGQAYSYNAAANLTTRIYGTFFVRKLGIEAIRHTLVPSFGFSFSPDLSDQVVQRHVRINDSTYSDLSKYDYSISGGPGQGRVSKNLTFSLANTFEMKIKDKKDTSKVSYKKVMLLDNVNLSGFYNLAADSFQLSNLSLSARTRLLSIFDINFNSVIDPYNYHPTRTSSGDITYVRQSSYAFAHGDGLGKIVSANLALSAAFRPKKKKGSTTAPRPYVEPWELQYIRNNSARYVDWNTPWSLNFSYITYFNNNTLTNQSTTTYNLTFSGDLTLTPSWKISAQSGYDFQAKNFSTTRLGIVRDLHCWNINFSWIPFGLATSYSVDIAVKAATLRDLKLSKQRTFYDN